MKVAYWFSPWKVHLFAFTSCIIPETAWVTRSSTHWDNFALKLHITFMVGLVMLLYLFLRLCRFSHAVTHMVSHWIFTLCPEPCIFYLLCFLCVEIDTDLQFSSIPSSQSKTKYSPKFFVDGVDVTERLVW